mgnify:FL=1
MNFMKTDYELKRSKRKTLSLTVTKDLKVSVKAPVGCPQKTIDDFVLSHEKWINEHIEKQKSRLSLEKTLDEKRVSELRALAAAELPRGILQRENGTLSGKCKNNLRSDKIRFVQR